MEDLFCSRELDILVGGNFTESNFNEPIDLLEMEPLKYKRTPVVVITTKNKSLFSHIEIETILAILKARLLSRGEFLHPMHLFHA